MKKQYRKVCGIIMAVILVISSLGFSTNPVKAASKTTEYSQGGQTKTIRVVQNMPQIVDSSKYKYKDYGQSTINLNAVLYDFANYNQGTPTYIGGFFNDAKGNKTFGISAYTRNTLEAQEDAGEAVAVLPSLLSALLMGIDKTNEKWDTGKYDFVKMANQFYNANYGMLMNNPGAKPDCEFWYMLYPQSLYARIYDQVKDKKGYKNAKVMKKNILAMADNYVRILPNFVDAEGNPDFDYTYYDFDLDKPVAAGQTEAPNHMIAFMLYAAYSSSGEQKYLDAMKSYMDWINESTKNANYEIMTDFGPSMAAIMNFKYGTNYDVEKFINWLFDGDSDSRGGWGITTGTWGDFAADGLAGSVTDHGGFGFQMNTMNLGGNLATTAKYDPRFSTDIGRWFLNATNSARAYFPLEMPSDQQSSGAMLTLKPELVNANGLSFITDPTGALGYEGLMKTFHEKTPFAAGDAWRAGDNEDSTLGDFCVYGSANVGLWGAAVTATNVTQILQIDLNKNDAFGNKEYPQFLYYNPYNSDKTITVDFKKGSILFDVNTKTIINKHSGKKTKITIPAAGSMNIVVLPAKAKVLHDNYSYLVNDDVIARDTTSVSITSPDVQRQNVEGTVEMTMSVEAPEAISNMTITAQDSSEKTVELYNGASVNTYKMDTTLLSNGLHNIIVSTTTVGGLYDQSSIKLVVYNKSVADQGEIVYQWNAQEISKMVSAPTMLSTSTYDAVKDSTRITENYKVEGSDVYLGAASTGNITIDFTRHPKIIIDVNEVGNSWLLVGQFPDAVYNKIEDKPTGIWSNDQSERFNSDSNDTGHITIDLQEFVENNNTKIDFSKPITMPIFLMIANSDGCFVDVSGMKIVYDDDPDAEQVVKTFSPSEMETYTGGLYNGLNADDGGLAMATALADSWVKLEYKNATDASWGATLQTSDVIVDFDRNPVVRFNVQNVSGSWCMKYRLADETTWDEDDKWGEYLIRDTAQTGRFEINIKDIMKDKTPTGKVSIHLIPFVLGDNGSSFELKDLQIVYPAVTEEKPIEVGAEYKLTLDKSLVVAKVGQKIQLSAKTAIASDLVWTVSDTSKSYVTVNQSGLVTATGVGFATVKVATADGKAEVLCRIAVYPAATKK